jgi:hypothetical protein
VASSCTSALSCLGARGQRATPARAREQLELQRAAPRRQEDLAPKLIDIDSVADMPERHRQRGRVAVQRRLRLEGHVAQFHLRRIGQAGAAAERAKPAERAERAERAACAGCTDRGDAQA